MEQTFITARPEDFDGVFSRIGKDWMLIGASDGERDNVMTASWGCLGVLWNKPVAICFIRPQRHTYSIAERAERLSLCFFAGEEHRSALTLCGRTSGRDHDKFAASGLTKLYSAHHVPYPAEASHVLLCRRLYADNLAPSSFLDPSLLSHYPSSDFHRLYICEIEELLVKE